MSEVPFAAFKASMEDKVCSVDMGKVVGKCDILFVCLDTLRYDAAVQEEAAGGTPVLNRYGAWEKRQAPGNFTYPSHHAIFAGFLPSRDDARSIAEKEMLFMPRSMGMGRKLPKGSYGFDAPNLVQGLHQDGYDTWCVGGVAFFDKRSQMGQVFPSFFEKSDWNPSFSCPVKDSTRNQVDFILRRLEQNTDPRKIFLYVNVCAIHYPNYFYLEEGAGKADAKQESATQEPGREEPKTQKSGRKEPHGAAAARTEDKKDSLKTHRAALRYVDGQLGRLFDGWKEKRGETFVVCFSDHGTCYGEDGYVFHGVNHPVVNTVPYKHFFL